MASRGDIKINEVQPDLNENWVTLNFQEVIQKPGTFVKLKSKEYEIVGKYPVVDQGEDLISGYVNTKELLYQGEIPVIIFGDHTRNLKFIDFEFAVGADGTKILKPKPYLNELFFYYYLKVLTVPSLGYSRHFSIIKTLSVPIPPLAEQKRIVAKLDEAFKHIVVLKSKLEQVPVLLKQFRQTVLTHAVTGKLTEELRKEKDLDEWEILSLTDVIKDRPRNGYSPSAVNYETPIKSLSLSATTSGIFKNEHVKYLDIKKPDVTSHLWLKNGDILIQRSNSLEFVGTAAIYTGDDYEFIYPDLMMKVQANDKIKMKYLYYVLSSESSRNYFKENATGTSGNMPKINQATLIKLVINLPKIEEQNLIIQRVESLLNIADRVEIQYQILKEKIVQLPQALLAKAFKGDLVTQLPTDGDAKDMLSEIIHLKRSK